MKFVGVRASLREIIKARLQLLTVLIHVKICEGLKNCMKIKTAVVWKKYE